MNLVSQLNTYVILEPITSNAPRLTSLTIHTPIFHRNIWIKSFGYGMANHRLALFFQAVQSVVVVFQLGDRFWRFRGRGSSTNFINITLMDLGKATLIVTYRIVSIQIPNCVPIINLIALYGLFACKDIEQTHLLEFCNSGANIQSHRWIQTLLFWLIHGFSNSTCVYWGNNWSGSNLTLKELPRSDHCLCSI